MNTRHLLNLIPAAIGYGVGSFKRGIEAGLSGTWEGSERTRQRRRPARALESQDRGLNYGLREDMLSEARAQAQTFPIARSINRKYANHVVGSCRMKWRTGDPAMDKTYADAWQTWMNIADLGGRHHFRKMSKIAVESILRDGQIFAQQDRRNGFLQISPIESDRVSSNGFFNVDKDGLVGGIGLDANGRATFIRVWERTLYGQFQNSVDIPRAEYVHAFDTDRFDAVTGVTHYHTILNAVRDLKETMEAEGLSAKRNSKLALLVKTISGGASAPAVNLYEDDAAPSDTAGSNVNVQRVNDVADAYMFPNEEMKSHTSERPSEGWRWLMEWLVREIALGLDLPFGVVWNMASLGGPGVRFDLGQANRVFRAFLEDVLEPMWFRPIVGSWITMEINQGRLPFHPKWFAYCTPRPASITIDLGRDSKAGIAENAAGLATATDWFAENDEDFEDQTDRLGYEASVRKATCEKYKCLPEDLRLLTAQGNPGSALAGPDQNQNATP